MKNYQTFSPQMQEAPFLKYKCSCTVCKKTWEKAWYYAIFKTQYLPKQFREPTDLKIPLSKITLISGWSASLWVWLVRGRARVSMLPKVLSCVAPRLAHRLLVERKVVVIAITEGWKGKRGEWMVSVDGRRRGGLLHKTQTESQQAIS